MSRFTFLANIGHCYQLVFALQITKEAWTGKPTKRDDLIALLNEVFHWRNESISNRTSASNPTGKGGQARTDTAGVETARIGEANFLRHCDGVSGSFGVLERE